MKRLGLLLAVAGATVWAIAQEQPPAAVVAAVVSAEPAEPAARATRGLLLDIASTGTQLFAVGERGNVLRSEDGKTWQQVLVPVRSTLTAVMFPDTENGWAVGHDAAILHTADGGKTWSLQHFKPELNRPLLDVFFIDASRGYAVGSFGLFLETADGGKTWLEVEADAIKEEGSHLNALVRLGDGQLLLVGERGFLALSSGGKTWDKLVSPYEGSFFGAVPMGEKGAVIFGLRGNAFVTADVRGGQWTVVDLGSTRTAFGGTLVSDGRAALVGADGLSLVVSADGKVSEGTLVDRSGRGGGGTLNSVVRWKDGLIAVGELGVQMKPGGG